MLGAFASLRNRRQCHQTAFIGDEDTVAPAMTDVIALLGVGAFFNAPLKSSIFVITEDCAR